MIITNHTCGHSVDENGNEFNDWLTVETEEHFVGRECDYCMNGGAWAIGMREKMHDYGIWELMDSPTQDTYALMIGDWSMAWEAYQAITW